MQVFLTLSYLLVFWFGSEAEVQLSVSNLAAGKAGEQFVILNLFTFQLSNSIKGEFLLYWERAAAVENPTTWTVPGSDEGFCAFSAVIFSGFGGNCKYVFAYLNVWGGTCACFCASQPQRMELSIFYPSSTRNLVLDCRNFSLHRLCLAPKPLKAKATFPGNPDTRVGGLGLFLFVLI